MKNTRRSSLALALCAAGLLVSFGAFGVPISSDLTITSSVELSTSSGQSPFSDGNVDQNGAIQNSVGPGPATTISPFQTTPGTADGVDDATTILPFSNPLTGALTDTGNGIGWSTDLNAALEAGDPVTFNEGYDFVIDFGIGLTNSSLVDTFAVTVAIDFSHTVNTNGPSLGGFDAYAVAGLDVELDGSDVLTSDIASDSLFGDENNGVPLGTFGDSVNDAGLFTIVIALNPGDSRLLTGTHQWEGGIFDLTSDSLVDVDASLTIVDVECRGPCGTQPPQPAPAPGTLALLGLALPGLTLLRRRRQQ